MATKMIVLTVDGKKYISIKDFIKFLKSEKKAALQVSGVSGADIVYTYLSQLIQYLKGTLN